jgi:LmbE family N-acetylglucosaminyl deacetylase
VLAAAVGAAAAVARPEDAPGELSITGSTRLLVFAPHPDDEVIGAGGLIQKVHAAGGAVQVVYLTNGEAYREGVRAVEGRIKPTAVDYRKYGQLRRDEAHAALGVLGLHSSQLRFLGFPQGLDQLLTRNWSKSSFRSPYTQLVRPARPDPLEPDARFRGADLRDEIAHVIETFRPTQILVTRKEDQHVDHCAAWFFVTDAVAQAEHEDPGVAPDVFTYIVHYFAWPFDDGSESLASPPGLSSGASGWLTVPLTRAEVRTKRTALHRYKSQMKVMDWFLEGFARTSEVFGHPVVPDPKLPFAKDPCSQFTDRKAHP